MREDEAAKLMTLADSAVTVTLPLEQYRALKKGLKQAVRDCGLLGEQIKRARTTLDARDGDPEPPPGLEAWVPDSEWSAWYKRSGERWLAFQASADQ